MSAITVNAPYQVVHDGTVYTPGQTAYVPDDLAEKWVDAGWATEAKAEPEKRAASKSAPKRAG